MAGDLRDLLQRALGSDLHVGEQEADNGTWRSFHARDTRLDVDDTVKALAPEIAADVDAARFWRNIRGAAAVEHRNLVPIVGAGEAEGIPYFVSRRVAGDSLRDLVAAYGPRAEDECRDLVRVLCQVLGPAHARGIIHGGITPETIIAAREGPMVTDLGVFPALMRSRRDGIALPAASGELPPLMPHDSLLYLAPELLTADPQFTPRTDIYALGAVLFALLTGTPPHGENDQSVGALVWPESYRFRYVSSEFTRLVTRCLAREPAERMETMDDVRAALDVRDERYVVG
ncbi:MAG TPA: serine/threonine-protein kinase [Gemmatimonadales bacterium]|jgi:serine/threonine-protein kinase